MNNQPRNGDFWVTLRSLGVYEGYFEVVQIYEGDFGVILVHFQKALVLQIDFNDFMQTASYYRASKSQIFIIRSLKRRFFRQNTINITSFCPKVVNMTTLIGPKRAQKQETLISPTYFEGSRVPGVFCEDEQLAERWRWEGVGGGKPSPLGLVWRFQGLEGLELSECIYTPRGTRPRRILGTWQGMNSSLGVRNMVGH